MKKLLSSEYERITFKAFDLPESDFNNYYSNVIYEFYESNDDIIDCLMRGIDTWLSWYREKLDYSPAWEIDEHGNKKLLDPEASCVPLIYILGRYNGVRTHVNKAFFDQQKKIVEYFGDIIKIRERQILFEKSLPEPVKLDLLQYKFPPLLDIKALQERLNLFENIHTKWLNDLPVNSDKVTKSTKSLKEMFTVPDWSKYLDVLTQCLPQLLVNENGKYRFIGNYKTQRGCIAAWFKYLKSKGIVEPSLNRDKMANILSSQILDFEIKGASIDNKSLFYETKLEKQLLELIK